MRTGIGKRDVIVALAVKPGVLAGLFGKPSRVGVSFLIGLHGGDVLPPRPWPNLLERTANQISGVNLRDREVTGKAAEIRVGRIR